MSRNWHATPHLDRGNEPTGAINIGESGSWARQVTMINPMARSWHKHAYVLWFGAYGWTRLHVYADSLEDALEECAGWLADHAPGLITRQGSDEYRDLMADECKERGLAWPMPAGCDDFEPYWEAEDAALADHTYTESGWIPSWEWGIGLEDPTTDELYTYITGG